MPFSFRKPVNLGGGARMTFSKSEVNPSVGEKEYRVTTGSRGIDVTLDARGTRYHQKADASQRIEVSSAATLEQLNTVGKEPAYAWAFVLGGGLAALFLAQIHFAFFILTFGLSLYVASIVHQQDKERRTFHLEYQLDKAAQQRWELLCHALSFLATSQKIWRISPVDPVYDWKRDAGASHLLTRTTATVQHKILPTIATNVSPVCLDMRSQKFFFFPDRVYILQNKRYGAVEYASLMLTVGATHFIESQGVPADSQTVGQTGQYVNKKGGPDRRLHNNAQIPIVVYGVAEFKSEMGINLLLYASSVDAVHQFALSFQSYYGQRQAHAHQGPQKIHPNCYQILGLNPSCTKEEASAKYRSQAMQYHPDRVTHLAPEFQQIATKKIQEINLAYEELKRLRGW